MAYHAAAEMKKTLTCILSIVLALTAFSGSAFAANITGIDQDPPEFQVKIGAPPGTYDNAKVSDIKATLNGEELVPNKIEKETASVEWIIMLDTSKSLSEEHFNAQKTAVLEVLKNLRDTDKLILYTFDATVVQKLYGNESPDAAKKVLDSIKSEGQQTAFYSAAIKLAQMAEQSQAAVCVPVIFSDGVETVNKDKRAGTISTLKKSPVPIYGYYPNVADDTIKKSFNEIIKASGGSTKSFSKSNAASQLAAFNSDDTYMIELTATKSIEASNNAKLTIDMGDGTVLNKEIVVSEWEGDKDPPEVITVVTDEERNTVSVTFSEIILNCKDESIYEFTVKDETLTPPKIKSISKSSPETVLINLDNVKVSGVQLTVKGYKDIAGNEGKEKTFTVTIDENIVKTLTNMGIGAGGALLLVLIILGIILKIKKEKKKKEEAKVQAAYKKGKKIEPKPEKPKKEKPGKEKLDAQQKAELERLEKQKKKEEERRRAEEAQFKFYFEEKGGNAEGEGTLKSRFERRERRNKSDPAGESNLPDDNNQSE